MTKPQLNEVGFQEIAVAPGACAVASGSTRLVARHVSSDLALVMHSTKAQIGVIVRVQALESSELVPTPVQSLWQYAETAVPVVLEELKRLKIPNADLSVYVVGSTDAESTSATEEFTSKTADAFKKLFLNEGIMLAGVDLGGKQSRNIWLDVESGRLIVRAVSTKEHSVQNCALEQLAS